MPHLVGRGLPALEKLAQLLFQPDERNIPQRSRPPEITGSLPPRRIDPRRHQTPVGVGVRSSFQHSFRVHRDPEGGQLHGGGDRVGKGIDDVLGNAIKRKDRQQ